MENIKFNDLPQFVDFVRSFDKKIGSGREGSCYRKGNYSYKLYNHMFRDGYNSFLSLSQMCQFKDVQIDNVYFVLGLILIGDYLVGSFASYVPGVSCGKTLLHRRNLDNLIKALEILRKNVWQLSMRGICIDDQCLTNILYDGRVFSLIDTVSYYYSDESVDSIYRTNMEMLMKGLFQNITNNYNSTSDNFVYAYLNFVNSPYKDYLSDIELMLKPDDTLRGMREVIQEGVGMEITTFSSVRKELLRVRKML